MIATHRKVRRPGEADEHRVWHAEITQLDPILVSFSVPLELPSGRTYEHAGKVVQQSRDRWGDRHADASDRVS